MTNSTDPFALFLDARTRAQQAGEPWDAASCALATVNDEGHPVVRFVLAKDVSAAGVVFFTNRESDKGQQLARHPFAAIAFHFDKVHTQFRFEGSVTRADDAVSDAYFAARPRISQLGAWASDQSRPLDARSTLEARLHEAEKRFEGKDVSRPPHWGGYVLTPQVIERWVEGEFRLHDRWRFEREGAEWRVTRRFP
jgi:pyridoxamine 5'-phosphate oxidase